MRVPSARVCSSAPPLTSGRNESKPIWGRPRGTQVHRQLERRRWSGAVGARGCFVLLAPLVVVLLVGCGGKKNARSAPTMKTPSFAAPRNYATGRLPGSVALGDLNGDGKPDLAVANTGFGNESPGETVSVLLNRG